MKNIFTVIAFLFVTSLLPAQNPALPNPGFENWIQHNNHYDPVSWNTLNDNTGILGVFTVTRVTGNDKRSGTYAIRLQTKSVFGQIANGIATTGTLITTPPYGVKGGIPYHARPDSIAGWYKCAPVGTDSGFVEFILKGSNNDSIGYVRFVTPNATVTTYTRFSAKINYTSSAIPDTAVWILSSSRGSNPIVNSVLFLDDLELIFNPIPCNKPTGTSSLNITSNSAKIKWGAVPGALTYQQSYRVFGTTTWQTVATNGGTNKVLNSLQSGTTYEWKVRAKCSLSPLTWSLWSTKRKFTTLTAREEIASFTGKANDLRIYPNPANEMLSVEMNTEKNEFLRLCVYNAIGQKVIERRVEAIELMINEKLDVSMLNNGIYMITISSSQMHSTKRLVIQ